MSGVTKFEKDVIDRLARIEERLSIHPPCKTVKFLQKAFWGAMVFIIVLLVPLALRAIAISL